ncbi:MAG: trigger factor [Methylococcales bacterium]
MQVTVEEPSGLNRTLKVQIPEDTIQKKVDQRIGNIRQKARIAGFRPGKVPAKVIRDRFGVQTRQEVISELLQSSFREALTEKDLNPAGTPEITDMQADAGTGLQYTANFEVFPEIEVKSCAELELKKPVCEVAEQDVDAMIEKLREQNRQWNAVDRSSEDGDRVQISYSFNADFDDESLKEGSSESLWILVGQPSLMPEFDEKVKNVSVGDHLNFSVVLPDDHKNREMAGKNVNFEIDVLNVEEPTLPEIDELFIQKFGVQEGTVEAFRAELMRNLEREMKATLRQRQKSDVLQTLYENNTVALPQVMIDAELKELLKPYQEAAEKKNADVDDPEIEKTLADEAKRRVALSLIIGKITADNNIQPDSDKVKDMISEIASGYEDPRALMEWYYSDKTRLSQIQQLALEDQVIEWVMNQATVVDQSITFSELMGVDNDAA